jgi:predicted ATPase/DNA-binding SARP family transcriptional activator
MGTSRLSDAADAIAVPPTALPVELTPFIGRRHELADLERLLAAGRLLTLTGAGGSGKTRLALELVDRASVARRGVAWVELASLDDPALIHQHVAEALGVRDEVRGPEALEALLRARGGLLVLDNCEHLVEACADLAHGLLRACPELRILATSREALGVKGERAWLVPPLSLPASGAVSPEEAESFEAIRLFVERAGDVLPGFGLTAANTGAVVEICRRLDGIPLAIELAAARVRVLPPEQIQGRLNDAFKILGSGGRTSVPRHRTLRATIDWSHDLLRDASKVMFRRQAVFRGGFTLESAEAVCAGDGIERDEVLDLIAKLVDRSLLMVREHDGAARYGPLETVRQYALDRLAESGEIEAVRRRHAERMLWLVEQAASHAKTPSRRIAFGSLAPEMDNIREALLWSRDHDAGLHVRLVGKLGWFWFSIGHWTEARRWVDGALALPDAASPGLARAELLFAGATLASLQADIAAARPWLEESAALAWAEGDLELRAYALNYLGMTYIQVGDPEGKAHCVTAEAWFREHGDDYGLRLALLLMGMADQMLGRSAEAIRLTEEAVAVARRFGQDRELTVSLQNLATLHVMQGSIAAAEPLVLEALDAARRDPMYFFIATTLDVLGEIRIHQGRTGEAGRILGAAESMREMIGARQFEINRRRHVPLLEALRAGPDAVTLERAWAAGRCLRMREILDEVLAGVPAPATTPALATAVGGPTGPEGGDVAADLHVSALGPLEVAAGGRVLGGESWPYTKPKELLLLLLLHPAGRTREQVGRVMWPGASATQVKNSFHVTLHHLRKALGSPEWIVIDGDRYRLAQSVRYELDAEKFEREARLALESPAPDARALRGILGRYRGELLEGEVMGDWVEEHRDRLRRLMVDLSLLLGAALESEGDHAAAAETYHGIAAREELNEEAQRRLMLAWARTGDRARAMRHYERLAALLRDELDTEPEPETVRVYESLQTPVIA